MAHLRYKTHGTCSVWIDVDVDDHGNVGNVRFTGGCEGNAKGICSLIRGMKATEVKNRLKGILCGKRPTSCPDQLAHALEEMGY
ncbi:TSCPD domain-containing protein [Segatella asaccharophila]